MQWYNLTAQIQHERLLKELNGTFGVLNHFDDVISGLGAYAGTMDGDEDDFPDYDGAEDFPIFDAHKLMQEFAAYFSAMMEGEYDKAIEYRAELHKAAIEMVRATLPDSLGNTTKNGG